MFLYFKIVKKAIRFFRSKQRLSRKKEDLPVQAIALWQYFIYVWQPFYSQVK